MILNKKTLPKIAKKKYNQQSVIEASTEPLPPGVN
jgi:hypothetical protein